MANYIGSGRSNYFRVKDEAAFRAFIDGFGELELWTHDEQGDLFGFGVISEDGSMPSERYNEETEEYEECDFIAGLQKHLADGEICVFMECGAEKLRYVHGAALAFTNNPDQGVLQISLDDIYARAREAFETDNVTQATY